MGTITARKNAKGKIRYTAQIRIKRDGKVVYTTAETFDREAAADAWIKKHERELKEPGGIERAKTPVVKLSDAIDRYLAEAAHIGRTKAQVLRTIKSYDIADMKCEDIGSDHIVAFAQELKPGRDSSTVGNYISHLSAIFEVAKPAWKYPLNHTEMKAAQVVLKKSLRIVSKSKQRDRRPTLSEADLLMLHFLKRQERVPQSCPMHRITAFGIFSTRRQDEICRITWDDFDEVGKRVLVRDMKHPGQKVGNDVWCDLPDEAVAIIKATPRIADKIFPYKANTISDGFTDACKVLGIENLRFHDLRHEGVSRLFEMGWTIPQVAAVSGHRSWDSLKRYAHLRQTGNKYENWKWLRIVIEP